MAIEYFCCYHSYVEVIEQLSDAEKGRLFMACLMYSKLGEVPPICGNERFVFPTFKAQIDRDKAKYDAKCRSQAENAKKRWDATAYHGMPSHANDAKTKTKTKTKTNANTPPTPSAEDEEANGKDPITLELDRLPIDLRGVAERWIKYKTERKERYQPTGLTALISQIINEAEKHGAQNVAEVIEYSMASGYKGITFDRLKQQSRFQSGKPQQGSRKLDDLELQAIRRAMEADDEEG